jgi:hypothetical protein
VRAMQALSEGGATQAANGGGRADRKGPPESAPISVVGRSTSSVHTLMKSVVDGWIWAMAYGSLFSCSYTASRNVMMSLVARKHMCYGSMQSCLSAGTVPIPSVLTSI